MDPALWAELEGPADDVVAAVMRLVPGAAPPARARVVARFGDIATIRVRRGELLVLREDPAVASLKAPRPMVPERPSGDRPNRPRRRFIRSLGKGQPRGRGTVIGVIDWGCDFTHPNVLTRDGRTRLLALWDQRARGRSVKPYGYGAVHTAAKIDRALEHDDPFEALGYDPREADEDGNGTHGMHVIDIAGGRPVVGPGGVAPAAQLVFVHLAALAWGPRRIASSVCLLEAVDFIARVAGEQPWVINLSLGSHAGPHDGTTLVEQALDAIVTSGPGRVIVQSCGNYRNRPVHAAGKLGHGARRRLSWHVDTSDLTPNEIELWYPGRDAIAMNLIAPDGRTLARALPDSHGPIVDGSKVIGRFAHRRHDPNNGDNQASIIVEPERTARGQWQVELEALSIADGSYHVWIERDEVTRGSQSRLGRRDFVAATTTGTICNGHHTISVGAYDPATRSQAWFSSLGPTRDGREKPDILARGVGVLGARSTPDGPDADDDDLLTHKTGTSMASPHVAGAVAVLYEAAGRPLTAAEVKQILVETAKHVGKGPPLLDVRAAVERVRASRAGDVPTARPMSPAELFDAFAVPSLRRVLRDVELVADVGSAPHAPIEQGDWLVERALGEGAIASLRVISDATKHDAARAKANRVVVRSRKRSTSRRFTPAGAALFAQPASAPPTIGSSVPRRTGKRVATIAPAAKRSARAEAIGGFLDTPQKATIGVNRRGLFLRVGYDVMYVAGFSREEQLVAMILAGIVGNAYTPLLAEEMRKDLGLQLKGVDDPNGPAKENETVASDGQTDIGTSSASVGLQILRWLRDTKKVTIDSKLFGDALWRRLLHAVAVEDAWLEVFEHTKSAGTLGRSYDTSILPNARRYYWVTQSMFTAIAWGLGPLVEKARVAYLAREANPDAKYGNPAFDDWVKAIEDLWRRFNEGADPLDAIRADSALAAHRGYKYLFPADEKEGRPARLRFIEFCLALDPKLAAKAKDTSRGTKEQKAAHEARKKLLDRFAEDYKIMLDLNTMANAGGEDVLHDQVSQANANPFPSSLTVSPKDEALPAGGDMGAEMNISADHWVSLWNYHYWWDLIRVESDGTEHETSTSRLTMLDRRLDRDTRNTRADFERLKREIGNECGPANMGALSVASSLAIIRYTGTVLKDILRAVFERPYEKSLVLPGPGNYMLRCIAGSTSSKGPLHRVPSAAYHLFRVVGRKELAEEQADAALQGLRLNELLWKPLTEMLLDEGTLEGDELEQKKSELAMINAEIAGDAPSLYAAQRANLQRGKTNKDIAAQISTDPAAVPRKIEEKFSEIDRILAERTRRLTGITGTPYRVITTLITDQGTMKLLIEAVDISTTDGFDVLVIDSTAKKSGFERRKQPTRVAAIRDALKDLLEEDVTGYGRGWCTILVPVDGKTGTGVHEKDTFQIEKNPRSMFNEMIEGESLIISVLALLAAPFTGGASLAILIPMGIIGAIPSGYRLAKRNEEGTFAWDMETALDVLNIASAFFGAGQMSSSALKLTRLATFFKFAGHGADGLNIIVGKAQFFKELEDISTDPNLLPSERRYRLALSISSTLMNDGVMVGHSLAMHMFGEMMRSGVDPMKFPLPKGLLPEGYTLPPINERTLPSNLKRASQDLHAKVKAIAKRDVVVLIDPELKGKSAEVRYVLDAFGFIDDIYIALGPKAGDAQLPSHAATARQLFKFTGLLGKARTLISWARAFFAKDPSRKVGKTRAWEARVELEKLPKQITDYMRMLGTELAAGVKKPGDVDAYIAGLFDQLALHEAALKDASRTTGKIAAHDTSQPVSPRELLFRDARRHAHAATGIPLDKISIVDAPATQKHISVTRDAAGKLDVRVPAGATDLDITQAIDKHQQLHERRPANFQTPDPTRPWSVDDEVAYQGRPEAEAGYHWELTPTGELDYVANDSRFPARTYDAAAGRHERSPGIPRKPHLPAPAGLGPKFNDAEVPGFYDGVDPDGGIGALNVDDQRDRRRGYVELATIVDAGDPNAKGAITNTYRPGKAELSLDAHFFNEDLPERVQTDPPLFSDGTPPTLLATIRQMRQLRIPRGGLRRLVLHQIQNVLTVLQVHLALKDLNTTLSMSTPEWSQLSERLQSTALGGYGRTIARNSGHTIVGVELGGNRARFELGDLMDWYRDQMVPNANPRKVGDLHDAYLDPNSTYRNGKFRELAQKLKDAGVSRKTEVVTDFDIILLLEDAP